MTAETITELDERTKEELRIRCTSIVRRTDMSVKSRCEDPAKWIIRYTCDAGHQTTVFNCDEHMRRLVAGEMCCTPCRPSIARALLVSAEPLR